MKALIASVLLVAGFSSAAQATELLASCQGKSTRLEVIEDGGYVKMVVNGQEVTNMTRVKDIGMVTYETEDSTLEIYGSIRSFGRLTGYLGLNGQKMKTVLCGIGTDIDLLDDETGLD